MPGSLVRARRKSQPVHWKENIFLFSETARQTWPWTQRYWGDLGGLFWNSSYLSVFWLWCLTRGPPAALSALSFPEDSTQRAGRALLLASFLFAHQSLWTLYPSLICMPPPGHGSLAQLPQTHCPGSWEEPVCPRILDYLKQPVGPEPTWPTCSFLPTPQQKH